jgi:class 3 adenylate cyclase
LDIAQWLREIGLPQYQAAFREHDVDAAVLPKLTADDLIGLGVTSIGNRRKILDAIAGLRQGSATAAKSAAEASAINAGSTSHEPERRQLTVMFCDIVGSTALSTRLDPEDMRLVIRAYQDACSGVVARYDGYIAKFMGDGVLAYFGYPRAHEDDAERAVRAGLEIADAIGKLETPAKEKLAVHVGIATGLVVVGDRVGEGSAQEQAVVGDTPNLAARLQNLAEPGSVVVAVATRRLLGASFQLRELGRQQIKGLTEPVEAFAVEAIRQSESRFDATASQRGLTPMVGREQEIGLLMERWRLAQDGDGQVVLLSG